VVDVAEGLFMPIPADLFGQDLRDPYQLTIYDLLLTIVIDYFLLTIDYFFVFLGHNWGHIFFYNLFMCK